MDIISTTLYHSPVGELAVGACRGSLCLCDWADPERRSHIDARLTGRLGMRIFSEASTVVDAAIAELEAYFAGALETFVTPLTLRGTDFQLTVWNELRKIPYGRTLSYSELARRIGRPRAVRAVAAACGANPLSIFVPCHRVVGSDSRLTGYAGGLEAKAALLRLERRDSGILPL